LAITFGSWFCLIGAVNPSGVMLVVLIESRLVVCDGDESKARVWDRKAIWPRELVAIIVPFMEATFIFFPVADKLMMILHNIIPFMAINIHAIFCLPILPAKSS